MRKRGPMKSSQLLALAGVLALAPAAFAQQWGAPGAQARPSTPDSAVRSATAQSGASQKSGLSLKLMDVLITALPSVQVDLQSNDNVYSTPDNKTSDQILVLKPAVRLETRQASNAYSVNLGATVGHYQQKTADNYTDYNINGLVDLDLGTRLRARLSADYLDGHDARGSNNNPISATPDRYQSLAGRGVVTYGAREARGRIDLELGQLRRTYYNNRATTAASDSTATDIGATLYWRVGPKTELLFQGKHGNVTYAQSSLNRDSTEDRLLLGATWQASAKTRGTFRIGMARKAFNDSERANTNTATWEGLITWSPRSYSHVDLSLLKTPAETTGGVGNFIDRTNTSATWRHDWNTQLQTTASVSYLTDAYQGAARTDNTMTYDLKASYRMRRWLSFGGGYANTARVSDASNFDYKRNVFTLFVNAAL